MKRRFLIMIVIFLCIPYFNKIIAEQTFDEVNDNEQEVIELYVPLDIEYGILKSINFSNTYTDENGQLYLLYIQERQYSIEMVFDSEYENVEILVNGDPIFYVDSVIVI